MWQNWDRSSEFSFNTPPTQSVKQTINHKINHPEAISTMPPFTQQVSAQSLHVPDAELERQMKVQKLYMLFSGAFSASFFLASFPGVAWDFRLKSSKINMARARSHSMQLWACWWRHLIHFGSFWGLPWILGLLHTARWSRRRGSALLRKHDQWQDGDTRIFPPLSMVRSHMWCSNLWAPICLSGPMCESLNPPFTSPGVNV